jgi:hypothetical protein
MRKVLVLFVVGLAGCGSGGTPATTQSTYRGPGSWDDPPKVVRSRDEFEKLVIGKNQMDIRKALGDPDSASGQNRTISRMHYKGVTKDPKTGQVDAVTSIWLTAADDPIAERVTYDGDKGG